MATTDGPRKPSHRAEAAKALYPLIDDVQSQVAQPHVKNTQLQQQMVKTAEIVRRIIDLLVQDGVSVSEGLEQVTVTRKAAEDKLAEIDSKGFPENPAAVRALRSYVRRMKANEQELNERFESLGRIHTSVSSNPTPIEAEGIEQEAQALDAGVGRELARMQREVANFPELIKAAEERMRTYVDEKDEATNLRIDGVEETAKKAKDRSKKALEATEGYDTRMGMIEGGQSSLNDRVTVVEKSNGGVVLTGAALVVPIIVGIIVAVIVFWLAVNMNVFPLIVVIVTACCGIGAWAILASFMHSRSSTRTTTHTSTRRSHGKVRDEDVDQAFKNRNHRTDFDDVIDGKERAAAQERRDREAADAPTTKTVVVKEHARHK